MTHGTARQLLGTAAAAAIIAAVVSLHAQAPAPQAAAPAFEVASIKRNNSGSGMSTRGGGPGGRINYVNVPAQQLILAAYQMQPFQVIGAPSWITGDRFDVIAKAPDGATPDQTPAMIRSLLAERFKLKAHTETRELPVYSLVKARADGRLGDKLKPSTLDCGPNGRGRGGPLPPGPGVAPGAPAAQAPLMGCRMMMTPGRLQAGGQPIAQLATLLSNQLGRPVIDKTGLTGAYDVELSFQMEGAGRIGGPAPIAPPGAAPILPPDPDAPTLVTAVQEQLGLKLESERGPVEVIVIDSIEQPTED
jgi:uncharacterized protein (TIGR03435 family)